MTSKRQNVDYNIVNVPEKGDYFVAHPNFNQEALSQFNLTNVPNLKIILLGDSAVGKTCLTTRMIYDEFSSSYLATVGASFIKCDFVINGNKSTLQVWDLAGQEEYNSVSLHYCRSAEIALFCFDLTRPETLANLNNWKARFLDITSSFSSLFLIGCKSDLKQTVSESEIRKFAEENQMEYFKTSSKEALNTTELMKRIGFYALLTAQEKRKGQTHKPQVSISDNVSTTETAPQTVNLAEDNGSKKKKKGCCK